jgi:hypothetical protein
MGNLFLNPYEGEPDTPTPINSSGGYRNAAGPFNLNRSLKRKVKSRKDLCQPQDFADPSTDSVARYFGDFSIESKRHVWDLLKKHPEYGAESPIRLNRVRNNTSEVLTNDPVKIIQNGGYTIYEHPETNGKHVQRPV